MSVTNTWIPSDAQSVQDGLAEALTALREELEVPRAFPPDVLAETERVIRTRKLPSWDRTDLDLVTIDPASSTDLDQAVFIERHGDGYTVYYAIADVPSFIAPGGALDAECRRRGLTLYAPDGRIPLHPEAISEDAGSLLPDVDRGAFLWEFTLDSTAAVVNSTVRRARVRSRAKLSYQGVQAAIDGGTAGECLRLLKEVGLKRIELERLRGGASLKLPAQVVEQDPGTGAYRLITEVPLPVEDWNAQISLMTGMAAADLMVRGSVGILRTMPAPDARSLETFERQTAALGKPWSAAGPGGMSYGEYLRTLDPAQPKDLAIIHAAAALFRGAGYVAFDGEVPADTVQAAIAAPYSHATAPLRRLVDRWVLVVCEALSQGTEVPAWARESLSQVPDLMKAAEQRSSRLDRAAIDTVEAAVMLPRLGEVFDAVVISTGNGKNATAPVATVQLLDPAVSARCTGAMEPGTRVKVRLDTADVQRRTVTFSLAEEAPSGSAQGGNPGNQPSIP